MKVRYEMKKCQNEPNKVCRLDLVLSWVNAGNKMDQKAKALEKERVCDIKKDAKH